jgi:hypothetical protein
MVPNTLISTIPQTGASETARETVGARATGKTSDRQIQEKSGEGSMIGREEQAITVTDSTIMSLMASNALSSVAARSCQNVAENDIYALLNSTKYSLLNIW